MEKTDLVVKYGPELSGGRLLIDAGECSGCEICSNLCPTGAISVDKRGAQKLFHFVGLTMHELLSVQRSLS